MTLQWCLHQEVHQFMLMMRLLTWCWTVWALLSILILLCLVGYCNDRPTVRIEFQSTKDAWTNGQMLGIATHNHGTLYATLYAAYIRWSCIVNLYLNSTQVINNMTGTATTSQFYLILGWYIVADLLQQCTHWWHGNGGTAALLYYHSHPVDNHITTLNQAGSHPQS